MLCRGGGEVCQSLVYKGEWVGVQSYSDAAADEACLGVSPTADLALADTYTQNVEDIEWSHMVKVGYLL